MLPSVVLAPPGRKAHNGTMKNQEPLRHFLFYTLSLPERALRSTVGLAAGAVKEMSEFLVPKAFQDSKTYKIVVRNTGNVPLTDLRLLYQFSPSTSPRRAAP